MDYKDFTLSFWDTNNVKVFFGVRHPIAHPLAIGVCSFSTIVGKRLRLFPFLIEGDVEVGLWYRRIPKTISIVIFEW